jgi:hypothetical protein
MTRSPAPPSLLITWPRDGLLVVEVLAVNDFVLKRLAADHLESLAREGTRSQLVTRARLAHSESEGRHAAALGPSAAAAAEPGHDRARLLRRLIRRLSPSPRAA